MELPADYENLCERYLLGDLSESESQQVEESYFTNDSFFECFLAVKDDLLDAYARGDLTGDKLKSFEQHYLASELRRQKLEEARELIQVASAAATKPIHAETESSRSLDTSRFSGWQMFARTLSLRPMLFRVGVVAALLVILLGGWIAVSLVQDWNTRRAKEEQAKTENVNSAVPSPTSNVDNVGKRSTPSPSPSATGKPAVVPKLPPLTSAQVASLTLLPFSSREPGGANSVSLSQEHRVVRLTLVFSAADDNFEVSVRTIEGQQVFRRGALKASSTATGKSVTITVDASQLSRQDYIVTLTGRGKNGKPATVGEYYFRVQHTATQSGATPPNN